MVITEKQIEELVPAIPNIRALVEADDFQELQTLLDLAIVDALDSSYNSTAESRRLQGLYDELYNQN
ncbi:MAG: hypothetical protein ACOX63_10095 [Christensenellales bacterium]|jgi:hypothetical protein